MKRRFFSEKSQKKCSLTALNQYFTNEVSGKKIVSKIKSRLSEAPLRKSLHTPGRKDRKFKVVAVCIIISTTFWFFSALNKDDYISQINYPIELVYNREAYIAVGDLPNSIPLQVNGGGWDLMTRWFGFNMKPVSIRLEQPDASDYLLTSTLRGQLTPRLDPVVINYILADSLTFDIQKKTSRTFRLRIDSTTINLDDGYRISSPIDITPDTVVWTGPEKLISQLPDALYINAEISNIDRDINRKTDLPELPPFFTSEAETTLLSFNVERMLTIEVNVTVTPINFPSTLWTLEPPAITASYLIPETLFDVADTAKLRVIADYKLIKPDSLIQLSVIKQNFMEDVHLSTPGIKAYKQ